MPQGRAGIGWMLYMAMKRWTDILLAAWLATAPAAVFALDPRGGKSAAEPTPNPSQEGIKIFSFPSSEGPGVGAPFPSSSGEAGSPVATPLVLDPFTLPITPAPAGCAELAPLLGVNIHFTRDDRGLDAARSSGFTWVRMDLLWAQIETAPGVYDFSAYDGLLADLAARGMRALLILDYGNPLYTGAANMPPTTSAALQAFGDFAEAAAYHFAGRGARYEIWNEPNNDIFWPPESDHDAYAALADEGIERVHAGDPAAEVCTAGLAGMDNMFLFEYLLAGGGADADAIGCHPYRESEPETAIDDVLFWRALVAQMLAHKPPSWVTEWGYSSAWFGDGHSASARKRHAVMVARELLTAWSLGFPLIIYYDLQDDGDSGSEMEHNFGLLARDYTDKPAMQAARVLSSFAAGRDCAGMIQTGTTNLYAMRLDGADDVTVALWAGEGANAVLVAPGTTAFTLLGESLPLQSSGAHLVCQVSDPDGPVYLRFPRTNIVPRAVGPGRVVGDYDGDGRADPARFDAAAGTWTVWMSAAGYAATTATNFLGQAADLPAVADYDGDGRVDPAVYRPSLETLLVRLSSAGYGQAELSLATEEEEVRVAPADFDGDGCEDPALYSTAAGQWILWLSGAGYGRSSVGGFGVGGDEPLAADFDGDGRADPAHYAAEGTWRLWLSGAGYGAAGPFDFGLPDACPVAGDFDGDGRADPGAVVSNSAWHAWLSSDRYAHCGPVELTP